MQRVSVPLLKNRQSSHDDLTAALLPAACYFTGAATLRFVSMEAGETAIAGEPFCQLLGTAARWKNPFVQESVSSLCGTLVFTVLPQQTHLSLT